MGRDRDYKKEKTEEEYVSEVEKLAYKGVLTVTDLMSCHGFAHMNCHQIDWFSVISQPHRAAA